MKTILRRKDKTSIFCPPVRRRHAASMAKNKVTELTVGCTLVVVGLFLMTNLH
jgi:hypothetical protein